MKIWMMFSLALTSCAPDPAPDPETSPTEVPDAARPERLCMSEFAPGEQPAARATPQACSWGEVELPAERGHVCDDRGCSARCGHQGDCRGIAVAVAQNYYAGRLPDGVHVVCGAGRCLWHVQ